MEQHRVALITGASRGLGLAIARRYAQQGVELVLTARDGRALAAAAEGLHQLAPVVVVPGDVADPGHAHALIDAGMRRFGAIDVLINNASALGPTPLPSLDAFPVEALDELFRVNVAAPLTLIQGVLPGMVARGRGVIINVTSDAAVEAYPGWGGYGASKAALEQLTRVLAAELAGGPGAGVRVYAVDPGDMDTAMHRAADPGADTSQLAQPEAVAPAFLRFLWEPLPEPGRYTAAALLAAGQATGSEASRPPAFAPVASGGR
jgi:NAD(P)-dependent dehydrogenase (short-subunit alcohol dehydrogenase family)